METWAQKQEVVSKTAVVEYLPLFDVRAQIIRRQIIRRTNQIQAEISVDTIDTQRKVTSSPSHHHPFLS